MFVGVHMSIPITIGLDVLFPDPIFIHNDCGTGLMKYKLFSIIFVTREIIWATKMKHFVPSKLSIVCIM